MDRDVRKEINGAFAGDAAARSEHGDASPAGD